MKVPLLGAKVGDDVQAQIFVPMLLVSNYLFMNH